MAVSSPCSGPASATLVRNGLSLLSTLPFFFRDHSVFSVPCLSHLISPRRARGGDRACDLCSIFVITIKQRPPAPARPRPARSVLQTRDNSCTLANPSIRHFYVCPFSHYCQRSRANSTPGKIASARNTRARAIERMPDRSRVRAGSGDGGENSLRNSNGADATVNSVIRNSSYNKSIDAR